MAKLKPAPKALLIAIVVGAGVFAIYKLRPGTEAIPVNPPVVSTPTQATPPPVATSPPQYIPPPTPSAAAKEDADAAARAANNAAAMNLPSTQQSQPQETSRDPGLDALMKAGKK